MRHRRFSAASAAFALAVTLAGCGEEREPAPAVAPTPSPAVSPAAETPIASIIRPEVAPEPEEPAPPQPLETAIGFPDGGHALDENAQEALRRVLESDQLAQGWPVVLRGHSDSAGGDEANLRVSRARARAVADWLIGQGVDEERIAVVALGEQNPAAPNALPDGTPNEEGRAQNRRVEITIAPPAATPEPEAGDENPGEPAPDDTA